MSIMLITGSLQCALSNVTTLGSYDFFYVNFKMYCFMYLCTLQIKFFWVNRNHPVSPSVCPNVLLAQILINV